MIQSTKLLFLFCLLPILQTAGNYSIFVPKVVRPGQQFKVTFNTHDASSNKKSGLRTFKPEIGMKDSNGKVIAIAEPVIMSDGSQSIKLSMPESLTGSFCEFYAKSDHVMKIDVSQNVTISRKVHSIFIQTDKGIYKPGQKVLFRVVAITPNLRAYEGEINISIYDVASNKIKELKNQKNENGVITSHLQLADPTPLGDWTIKAESKFATSEQTFTVDEYVLPKFEVTVEAPSVYHVNLLNQPLQKDLKAIVLAKYTFGKVVEGIAHVSIKLARWFPWLRESQSFIKRIIVLKDGKADVLVTFNELRRLLPSTWTLDQLAYQTISIEANVTESLTGITLSSEKEIRCQRYYYKIEFAPSTPNNFKPGLNFEAYLRLLRNDGSQPDMSELTTADGEFKSVMVTIRREYDSARRGFEKILPSLEFKLNLYFNKHGVATLIFPTDIKTDNINFEASFYDDVSNATIYDSKYISKFTTRDKAGITVRLLNREKLIKPDVYLVFQITTVVPIRKYTFQVLSKGNIVYAVRQVLERKKRIFNKYIKIQPHLLSLIAPEARFVVSYVTKKGELVADSLALNVVDYMTNKISLSFNKNVTEPGNNNILLDVKSDAMSFVALLGVDLSVLLLNKGNDITNDLVSSELVSYSDIHHGSSFPGFFGARCFDCGFWPLWLGGSNTDRIFDNAGLHVLTDLYIEKKQHSPMRFMMDNGNLAFAGVPEVQKGGEGGQAASDTSVKVRKDFPETFIWAEDTTDPNGKIQFSFQVPDTITTWVATGFSVSPEKGLGITSTPAELRVIKPLFIMMNLPYSIVRGEAFVLQANIFNYAGQDIKGEVKLLESKYFKIINCSTEEPEAKNVIRNVELKNNAGTPVFYWIVATSLGQIPIEIRVLTASVSDAVRATLLVKPEGQPQSYTTSELIQLKPGGSFDGTFQVELPGEDILVPGSVNVEVTVIGDMIGSALNNIEDLLKMPYGCGEQNLVGFAPDVYILDYLKKSARLTDTIKSKAIEFINSGYQRQLTYQRSDGSFSAFGESDKSGSTWLSGFTIKSFSQAAAYIPIEDEKIAKTLNWIIENQQTTGTFVEPPGGRVIHTAMQGGSSSGIAMTAYLLIAIIQNKNNSVVDQKLLDDSIDNARVYLEAAYQNYTTDPYALAITAYALFKAESPELPNILNLLEKLAIDEGGLRHWEGKKETPSDTWRSRYGQPKSYDVELASYVLLIFAEKKDLDKSLPIAKWLLTQRNAFGGFSSTQDTVLGLEALAAFATLIAAPVEGSGIVVSVKSDSDNILHTLDPITQNNVLLLQSVKLPEETKSVAVHAENAGVALVQLIVTYNVFTGDNNDLLELELSTVTPNEKSIVINVTTSWKGPEPSGMVVIEVNYLTGYVVEREDLTNSQLGKIFKKLEKKADKLVIYLDELTSKDLKFNVYLKQLISVKNAKPALVKVYRYYDQEYTAADFYSTSNDPTLRGACPACC